jgi:hypothetical protein
MWRTFLSTTTSLALATGGLLLLSTPVASTATAACGTPPLRLTLLDGSGAVLNLGRAHLSIRGSGL